MSNSSYILEKSPCALQMQNKFCRPPSLQRLSAYYAGSETVSTIREKTRQTSNENWLKHISCGK